MFYKRDYLPAGQSVLIDIAGQWDFDYYLNGQLDQLKGLYSISAVPEPQT